MTVNGLLGRTIVKGGTRCTRHALVSMIVGLVVGFCLAELFMLSTPEEPEWFFYLNHRQGAGPEIEVGSQHQHLHKNSSVAQKLYNEVRVLCWIMTNPKNHRSKARHVKETWGKRCNKLLFMSSAEDKELGTVVLPVSEGRDNLWAKTKAAYKYIYDNHLDDADWFFKADDDTYTIVENLRFLLYPYTAETPIYFGCRFKPYVEQGYMSGGSGYVLSKEAVRRFVEKAMPNEQLCRSSSGGAEDVEIGKCLQNVNVTAGDSRDARARGRFFPLEPEFYLMPKKRNKKFWYWKYIYYKAEQGLDCCSDHAVSFHYVPPSQMYLYDYLIYHVRPYGISKPPETLPYMLRSETSIESGPDAS